MNVNPLSKTLFETLNKMPPNITQAPFIDTNAHKRALEVIIIIIILINTFFIFIIIFYIFKLIIVILL